MRARAAAVARIRAAARREVFIRHAVVADRRGSNGLEGLPRIRINLQHAGYVDGVQRAARGIAEICFRVAGDYGNRRAARDAYVGSTRARNCLRNEFVSGAEICFNNGQIEPSGKRVEGCCCQRLTRVFENLGELCFQLFRRAVFKELLELGYVYHFGEQLVGDIFDHLVDLVAKCQRIRRG